MRKYILLFLLFGAVFSCSSDDDKSIKTKEEIEKEYIERSKVRLKPFLSKWILENEIHPFETFILFNSPIDDSFRYIEFEVSRYVSMENQNGVLHAGNMRYGYNDRINMEIEHSIKIGEKSIENEPEKYYIYFEFRNFNNQNKYKMALLDEDTLELSYVDKKTQKTKTLNLIRSIE